MGVVSTGCGDMVAIYGSSKRCCHRDDGEDTEYGSHRFRLRERCPICNHPRITTYLGLCRIGKETQYGLSFEIWNAESD